MKTKKLEHRLPRPTRGGGVLAVWSVACGLWGLQLNNNHLFLLACLLMGVLVTSFPLAWLNLTGITANLRIVTPLHAGARFNLHVGLANRKRFFPSCLLTVRTLIEGSGIPSHAALFLSRVPRIDANEELIVSQKGLFFRRGEKNFLGVRLLSLFPLGLYSFSRWLDAPESLLVYPRLRPVSSQLMPPLAFSSRARSAHLRPSRGDEEFKGLREFKPGDNPKWIHWKSSARLEGKLLLRELEDPTVQRVQVVLDCRVLGKAVGFVSSFERAVQLAASLLNHLVRNDIAVDFSVVGEEPDRIEVLPRSSMLEDAFRLLSLLQPSLFSQVLIDEERDAGRRVFAQAPRLVIDPKLLDPRRSIEAQLLWEM